MIPDADARHCLYALRYALIAYYASVRRREDYARHDEIMLLRHDVTC